MTSQNAGDVPCKGCPDSVYPTALDVPEGIIPSHQDVLKGLPGGTSNDPLPDLPDITYSDIWGVYIGGPPETHLVGNVMLFPEELSELLMHPDGSIEYKKRLDDWEPPSPIEGYERDLENQWLFHPLWESCTRRQYKVAYKKKCRCIDLIAMCSVNLHWVKFENCQKCQVRIPIKTIEKPVRKTIHTLRCPDLDHSSTLTKFDRA